MFSCTYWWSLCVLQLQQSDWVSSVLFQLMQIFRASIHPLIFLMSIILTHSQQLVHTLGEWLGNAMAVLCFIDFGIVALGLLAIHCYCQRARLQRRLPKEYAHCRQSSHDASWCLLQRDFHVLAILNWLQCTLSLLDVSKSKTFPSKIETDTNFTHWG